MIKPQAARRLSSVLHPVIPKLGRLLRDHPGSLSLGQGIVSWGPPESVRSALSNLTTQSGSIDHYGPMGGDPELIERLTDVLRMRYKFDLDESCLIATAGSNMAFNAIAQVICDPGDQIILPIPYYFNHVMAVQLAGAEALPVDAGLLLDPERLQTSITSRTRAIVTISPGNPSGVVLPESRLKEINRICEANGLFHIHDEAYAAFCHGEILHWSPGSSSGSGGHTVTLRSFSKSHGMAGWRLGYMVAPQQLLSSLSKVQDTIAICPSRPMQRAALAALNVPSSWVEQKVKTLEPNRHMMLNMFRQMDIPWQLLTNSDGAFYGLVGLPDGLSHRFEQGPYELMEILVQQFGVGVVSGHSFGINASSFRISYGMLNERDFEEAMQRLSNGLRCLAQTERINHG